MVKKIPVKLSIFLLSRECPVNFLNPDYVGALVAAIDRFLGTRRPGRISQRSSPYLWSNRLIERNITQVFLKLNLVGRF